jgi:Flp pilus assembly protein TadG
METSILSSLRNPIRYGQLSGLGREAVRGQRQDGAVAVVFAVALIGLIGICGLALDLAVVYNRKVEMRNVADAAALNAARRLNGTATGINDAVTAAAAAATSLRYQYDRTTIAWSASAIRFSTSPDRNGDWVDAGTAAATAARIFYVKVDTSQLDSAGDVQTMLMPVLNSTFATVTANSDAIAGRTSIDVAPLAVCAMPPNPALPPSPAVPRPNSASYVELVEYGFRRGVSYDLMNLNPGLNPGTVATANFVVNPLAPPGTAGSANDMQPSTVGPYVCTGTLDIPRLAGDTIAVAQPFPLPSLYKQLNSRFDQYEDGLCNFHAAPPDINIKSFISTLSIVPPWMKTPTVQTAVCNGGKAAVPCTTPTDVMKLQTIADLPPPGGTAAQYGPVWAYAKAVPFSAYVSGVPEPSPNGYTTFPTASWSTLYGGQTVGVGTYPSGSSTPYKAGSGVNFLAPVAAHKPGAKGRRVLNVPLLDCSVAPGNTATVLAIGRFFMTVPATATSLAAEFAGAVPLQYIDGRVSLFP